MEFEKLSKQDLIEHIKHLETKINLHKTTFYKVLEKYFSDESILSRFGKDEINFISLYNHKGEYLEYNNAFKTIFEKEIGHNQIKSLFDIIDPQIKEQVVTFLNNKELESKRILRVKNKEKNSLFFECHNYKLKSKTGETLILTSAKNITAETISNSRLKIALDNQQEILSSIDEVIYRLQINNTPLDTTFLYASTKMVDILGFEPEDFIKDCSLWKNSIHPEDLKDFEHKSQYLFNHKVNGIKEYRFKHNISKEYIWVQDKVFLKQDEEGNIVQQFGVINDITEQKNVLQESQKTSARFKNLFDSSNDAVIILEDEKVTNCNLGAITLFNKTKSELIKYGIEDLKESEYNGKNFKSLLKKAENGIPQHFEWILGNDKSQKIIDVTINRLFLEKDIFLQLIIRDISEQIEAKVKIETSEKSFRDLFDNSSELIYILDEMGKFIDINQTVINKYGYTRKEIIGNTPEIFSEPNKNDLESVRELIKKAFTGEEQRTDWWAMTKNKEVFLKELVLRRGKYFNQDAVIAIGRDISERLKAEKEIRESEKSFKEVFNNSSDIIFIIDENDLFIDANNEFLKHFEYKKKELKDLKTKNLTYQNQDLGHAKKAWKGTPQFFEWIAKSKNGKKLLLEIKLKKSEYFGKNVLIANARDISERRKNEFALKLSEEKFRRLFSTANDAIFIIEDNKFTDCNEETLKMFDCKKEEIIGFSPYEFSPKHQPDGRLSFEKAIEKMNKTLQGKAQNFYWEHLTKKRIPFDAEISLSHFELDGKIFIQAIVRDISEKMKADKALKASEAKFKTIADNAPVLIRMTDNENKTYYFSTQFLNFLGEPIQNVAEKKWYDSIHIEEKELVYDTHNHAFNKKLKFEISYRIKNYAGKYRWILETGIPHFDDERQFVGFITASIDITGRKTVEEALKNEETLRKSNELFKETLETISLISVSLDRKGNITFCNNQFAKTVGESQDNLIGKNWFDLFVPIEKRKARKKLFKERVKEERMPMNITSTIQSFNKKEIKLSWHNIFLRNEKNEIVGVTSIGEDITKTSKDKLIKEVYNNINNYSIQSSSLKEFYKNVHNEVNKLFKTNNLFISIQNKKENKAFYPYYRDENYPLIDEIASTEYEGSLNEYVIESDKTQVLNRFDFVTLNKNNEKVPMQWVGIPLKTKENAFGVLVVQDYKKENYFSDSDIEILIFISNQIALATERIRNEKLIIKNEHKFRSIFENLQDIYYRTDLNGKITLISPSIENFTTLKSDYFIGKDIKSLYNNPEELIKVLEQLQDLEFIKNFQSVVKLPEGKEFSVQVNIKLTRDENGYPIGIEGMIRDVTEILKAQDLIKQNEEKFRNIFESLQDVYYRADIKGKLEVVSPSIFEMTGYTPENLIGKRINNLYLNKEDARDFFNLIQDNTVLKNYETQLIKSDGSYINVLANIKIVSNKKGKPIGIEGIIRDISDIKQTEENLKLFENIIQNSWDAIIFSDLNGSIKYINEAANKLYNYSDKELLNDNVDTFNSHLTHNLDDVAYSIQKYGGWVGEIKQKKKNGEIFDALLSVQLIFNKKGEPMGMATHSKDISDRKKEERELLESKELAESLLKVKEQFLANMSHELRTPMNGIIGITELLKDSPLKEEQQELVSIIQKSSHNLLHILNDILDLSKIEAGKIEISPAPTILKDILLKVSSLFEYQIRNKDLELHYKIDDNIPEIIFIDETRIIQILSNLVSNAIKFTDKGSISIYVKLFKSLENGKIQILFEVIDTGIGIEKTEFGKLFNYFSQIDNTFSKEYKGTGLGLAISKELAILMGGEIGIKSKPKKGSTFWFTITTSEAKKIQLDNVNKENKQNITKQNILVVDDNAVNLKVAEKLIEKLGGNVVVIESGVKALELLKKKEFDIIFMDIQMPEMNGIETLEKIKERNITTPVIAMTAYAMKTDREKFINLGFNDYVAKPVTGKVINDIISKWSDNTITPTTPPNKYNDSLSKLIDLGGEDFLIEILNEYVNETLSIIENLKKHHSESNFDEIANFLHTLKGSSSTLGLMNISEQCKQGESACKNKNLEKIKFIIAEIIKLFDNFRIEYEIDLNNS